MLRILSTALLFGLFCHAAKAQQVTVICYQIPGNPSPSCVPVSTANPLPVISN